MSKPFEPPFTASPEPWGRALRCEPFPAPHLFTTRDVNVRAGMDDTEKAWRSVAASIGVDESRLARATQVHGRGVLLIRRGGPVELDDWPDADIVISDDPDLALTVRVADCVPILIADQRLGVAGAAHAGWRGTSLGVARAVVEALRDAFGSDPGDLCAAIGPSIGPAAYEVGDAVLAAFEDEGHDAPSLARWFPHVDGALAHLDLWAANTDQLIEAGVPREQVWCARACTLSHPGWFFSHRGEGELTGRMVAAVRPTGR
jgi:hypothetical protein